MELEFHDSDAETYPLGHYTYKEKPSSYFRVERESSERDDVLFFLQVQMDDAAIKAVSNEDVVAVLWLDSQSRCYFQTLRRMSLKAGDWSFYHGAIKAAATLVYLVFTKDLIHEEIDKTTKDAVFEDLMTVVGSMEPPPRLKDDDFTRLLIKLARMDAANYEQILLTKIAMMVNRDDLKHLSRVDDQLSLKEVDWQLKDLISCLFITAELRIKRHLMMVNSDLESFLPVDILHDILHDVRVYSYVYEIMEVAELRCITLGSRFINKTHLIWALYECGYGLPRKIWDISKSDIVIKDGPRRKIWKMLKLNYCNEDKDIFWNSCLLVKWLGVEQMRVEHFIFSLLYFENIVVDMIERIGEIISDFAEFLKEVDSDSIMRPKISHGSSQKFPFESYGLNYDVSLVELNEVLKSGKLDDLVRKCSSMMVA